jgi:ABC-type lipoprotein export system ATPase subunit
MLSDVGDTPVQITVQNFSSISQASLGLAPITIIIGPQGSGKSVLSKLFYFTNDMTRQIIQSVERDHDFKTFCTDLEEEFSRWFPPSAWGDRRFTVNYKAKKYSFEFARARTRGNTKKVRFLPDGEMRVGYEELIDVYNKIKDAPKKREYDEFDVPFRFQRIATERMRKELGSDFLDYQLFIPAGRSFFTVFGKAMTAFEQSNLLDPVTVRFGRIFGRVREMHAGNFAYYPRRRREILPSGLIKDLLGGEMKVERDNEYLMSSDGRKIPFSVLSSGQQELLPLLMMLNSSIIDRDTPSNNLIFIEEPEAHLFPESQSLLIELLASMVGYSGFKYNLLLTTHSPYVLSKFNNLIYASSLVQKYPKASHDVEQIVPKSEHILPKNLLAFAIIDGELISIKDGDEIKGEYLDSISDRIGLQFEHLLEVEGRYGSR